MNNKECCNNCKYRCKLEKWDYSQGGCKHSDYEGFACVVFADESFVPHMVGIPGDGPYDLCEMFTPKEKTI